MPVSGLVVTLTPETTGSPAPPVPPVPPVPPDSPDFRDSPGQSPGPRATARSVQQQIRQHPNFQTGPRQDHRLPVVLDTPDRETDKRCWCWLNELPGVHHVDVAFIHFEDGDAIGSSCRSDPTTVPIAAPTIGET